MVEKTIFRPGCLKYRCISNCVLKPIIADVIESVNGPGGYDQDVGIFTRDYVIYNKKGKTIGRYNISLDFENSQCKHTIKYEPSFKEKNILDKVWRESDKMFCKGFIKKPFLCSEENKDTKRCRNKESCESYYKMMPHKDIPRN